MLPCRIACLRRSVGMNQLQLARKLHLSPSTIGMYEQGRREPSADTLVALARELGVTTDFLLTGRVTDALDEQTYSRMLRSLVSQADRRLEARPERPFSRQELAVLLAALLME